MSVLTNSPIIIGVIIDSSGNLCVFSGFFWWSRLIIYVLLVTSPFRCRSKEYQTKARP
jgi:hypothetical protein